MLSGAEVGGFQGQCRNNVEGDRERHVTSNSVLGVCVHVYTRVHTYVHVCVHAYAHAYTDTQMHMYTHTHTRIPYSHQLLSHLYF